MQHILADVYRLIFKISNNHLLSKLIAIAYTTILTCMVAYGVVMLLQDILPSSIATILITRPYNIVINTVFVIIIAIVYLRLIPTNRQIMIIGPRVRKSFLLYLFTALAVLCYFYIRSAGE